MSIRLIVALIVGLLFCTLATLEFPELMTLSDDTSNDYSPAIFQSSAESILQLQKTGFSRQAAQKNPQGERRLALANLPDPPYRNTDPLPLMCVQRT